MRSKVTDKGQVTIPKLHRDRLGIRPGEEVEFDLEDGRLVLRRVVPSDPLRRLLGLIREPVDVDNYLAETRGPAFDPGVDPEGPLDEEPE